MLIAECLGAAQCLGVGRVRERNCVFQRNAVQRNAIDATLHLPDAWREEHLRAA